MLQSAAELRAAPSAAWQTSLKSLQLHLHAKQSVSVRAAYSGGFHHYHHHRHSADAAAPAPHCGSELWAQQEQLQVDGQSCFPIKLIHSDQIFAFFLSYFWPNSLLETTFLVHFVPLLTLLSDGNYWCASWSCHEQPGGCYLTARNPCKHTSWRGRSCLSIPATSIFNDVDFSGRKNKPGRSESSLQYRVWPAGGSRAPFKEWLRHTGADKERESNLQYFNIS